MTRSHISSARSPDDGVFPATRTGLGRGALNVAAFIIAVLSAFALPRFDHGDLGDKLHDFRGGEYEMAFIGSSWTEMNILPEVFDARMAELGTTASSYNMGMSGAYQGEVSYVADRLLENPGKLRFVFIDPSPWSALRNSGSVMLDEKTLTVRDENWHTLRNTLIALKYVQIAPAWIAEESRKRHLRLFAYRFLRLGSKFERRNPVANRGFRPSLSEQSEEEYAASLRFFHTGEVTKLETWTALDHPELERTIARLRAANIIPILVIPPIATQTSILASAREFIQSHADVPCFDYARPDKFGALFNYSERSDYQHLNAHGAKVYSMKLAEDFSSWTKGLDTDASISAPFGGPKPISELSSDEDNAASRTRSPLKSPDNFQGRSVSVNPPAFSETENPSARRDGRRLLARRDTLDAGVVRTVSGRAEYSQPGR